MKRLLPVTIAALIALVILVALGTWQVKRLAWKEGLISAATERTAATAVDLPAVADWSQLRPEDYQYRRVAVSGRFAHDREVHVYTTLTRPKGALGGPGYWVMTPLQRDDGTVVIVNRGFVPLDRKDAATRIDGQVEGPVAFEALMRPAEPRDRFSAADNLAKNVWVRRDPARIAAHFGLDPATVAPFFLDAVESPPGGLPQAGETQLSFVNNHLQYAVTWYGLAVVLVVVFALFIRRRRREFADG